MKVLPSVCLTLLFSVADAFFGFTLYVHWNHYGLFGRDVYHYDFAHSSFELWLLSLLRAVLLAGASAGVLANPRDGVRRVKAATLLPALLAVLAILYAVAKILVYTEYLDGDHSNDVWFLTLAFWTIVASLCMHGLWIHILRTARPPAERRKFDLLINDKEEEEDNDSSSDSGSSGSDDSSDDDDESEEEGEGKDGEQTGVKRKKPKAKSYSAVIRLLSISKQDWPYITVGFIALLCSGVCEVFLPLYTGKVIDGVVLIKDRPHFLNSIMMMAVISLGVALANGIRGGFFSFAIARLRFRITNMLYESIVKQEIGFFDKTRTGAITSRLTSDTSTMSNALGRNINVFMRSMVQIGGYVVFMLIISWRLTVITLVTFPLLAIVSDIFGSYYEKLSQKVQSSLARANIVAEETISTMKTVRSFANEGGEQRAYRSRLLVTLQLRKKESVAYAFYESFNSIFELFMFVVTLFYGGHLVVNDKMSGGMLVSFILYQLELGGCLEDIGDVFTDLMKAAGASRKVFKLIDRKPTFENNGTLVPREFKGHLEFQNVSFAYPNRPSVPVLKDVSFSARPGEVIALVGPSGGGKTTCVGLIEHFYEPNAGRVLLDGMDVRKYDHQYLHGKVALVGQEPVLYARSIEDNISYSMEDCSGERIERAARMANAHAFISRLKKGYRTETGEKGLTLSGGQKQRVAIARALVRDPQVLLLDEATSALDSESEHLVQQALMRNFGTRTVVIVAHRLSTVEKADRIVVIDHGSVQEQGRHQELLQAGGIYAQLVRRQMLGRGGSDTESDVDVALVHDKLKDHRGASGDVQPLDRLADDRECNGHSTPDDGRHRREDARSGVVSGPAGRRERRKLPDRRGSSAGSCSGSSNSPGSSDSDSDDSLP